MGFFKNQFRKVIQWESDNVNDIIYKYPLERKEEIMRKSALVVREGQKALFIQEGKLADVFEPGTYQLNDIKNFPLLTQLYICGKVLIRATCILYRQNSFSI